ncbi:MAG: hypothetical protein ACP5JB_05625 [candidate division WOR-3 bacterium]
MSIISMAGRGTRLVPLLLLLFFSSASTQTPREEQLHQLLQIEGTNTQVRQFFKSLNIPYKSDTVYVVIVSPMIAARVEGGINPFIHYLRKQGVKQDIILLAVSNKKRAAERYLARRNFSADYQMVTGEDFLNSFEFSAGMLEVPFVTKFAVSTGELLASYALLAKIDSSTVGAFINDFSRPRSKIGSKSKQPALSLKSKGKRYKLYKPVFNKRIKLYDTEEYPLSTTHYISISPSGTYLALTDQMTWFIYIFDLSTGQLVKVLYPDSGEERLFINLPSEIIPTLKQMNMINPMYFSHQFSDDTTLLITASLPNMAMEIKVVGNDTTVTYSCANEPVLLKKRLSSNQLLSCVSLQHLPDTVYGAFFHTDAAIIPKTGLVFAPFSKGWPQGSEILDEQHTPPEANPFTAQFYQRDLYQFAVFDTTGRFIRFLGRLGKQFVDLKLGYLVSNGYVRFQDNRYYTTDRYSGKIYIYDLDFVLRDSLCVFDNPQPVFPLSDHSKDPLKYLLETFKANFRRRIIDFQIVGNLCYALITEDNQPVLYQKELKQNKIRKFPLPLQFEKEKAKYYLLREADTGMLAIALLESPSGETFYCELKLP